MGWLTCWQKGNGELQLGQVPAAVTNLLYASGHRILRNGGELTGSRGIYRDHEVPASTQTSGTRLGVRYHII